MTTRVLIVDDERNVQKAYKSDIASAPERYELVDAIANAADAELICRWKPVDLVLMDVNTANNESGLVASETIRRLFPRIKIIMTTSYLDARAIDRARAIGVESFWFKDFSHMELLEVMDRTMRGESCYPESIPPVALGDTFLSEFSSTEMRVLYLLLEFVSIRKIAEKMVVEESTVKWHLKNMCAKAGCENKADLAIKAANAKIVLPKLKHHDDF